MGTHPIFESDFDCLTEIEIMSSQKMPHNPVPKLYSGVINEVIDQVRDSFLDEGIDESVLSDLKMLWKRKLEESKALEEHKSPEQVTYMLMPRSEAAQIPQYRHEHQYRPGYHPNHRPPVSGRQPDYGHSQVIPQMHQNSQIYPGQRLNYPQVRPTNQQVRLPPQPNRQPLIVNRNDPRAHGRPQLHMLQPPVTQRIIQPNQPPRHLHHQPHVQQTSVIQQNFQHRQHDGPGDDDSELSDETDSDESEADQNPATNQTNRQEDEESLNSADDVSGTDATEIFETENVVVCQFDKIQRVRNKWRFHLKDGIMSLNGKDFVFQKATGDGEW